MSQTAFYLCSLMRFSCSVKQKICTTRTNSETGILRGVTLKACSVSFTGPSGVRHSVEVTADSLYEAAIVGFSLLKQDGWVDPVAPGTRLEVQVRHPATTHSVSLA